MQRQVTGDNEMTTGIESCFRFSLMFALKEWTPESHLPPHPTLKYHKRILNLQKSKRIQRVCKNIHILSPKLLGSLNENFLRIQVSNSG